MLDPLVTALLPIALSLAQFPGSWPPPAVIGLFLLLELAATTPSSRGCTVRSLAFRRWPWSSPPGGLAHTRYLCKRLRARCPQLKIIVGRWERKDNVAENRDQLQEAGADLVATCPLETRKQ